jgi:membrane associated rhomboid family serine protease
MDGDVNRFGTVAFYAALGKAFVTMCAVIPVLFLIELLDFATAHQLDQLGGIRPRELDGLDGVVFAPLLHANFNHLYGNSVPLLLTGTFVLASGARRFLLVTGLVALVSGLGAWFFGPAHTVGIGASGVVFGYLGFLLVRGIVERSWWSIAVSVLIGILFGWTLVGILPTDQRISWQAHLFGLIGGIAAAVVFRRRRPRPEPSVPPADLLGPIGIPPVPTPPVPTPPVPMPPAE